MQKKLNPWDIGPTELIKFALERMHGGTDFDKRLAFLVLDIGVETFFKTFLTIPEKYSQAQTSFSKRREAVSGNFHALVAGIREAVPERIENINLEHVQYYHEIRNTLYHQGNTVAAVRIDQLSEYAILAVELLRELLGVDLSEDLIPLEPEPRPGDDPVADSVEVEISSGRYRIERLKSNSIRATHIESGKFANPVKPILRDIIQEHGLPVDPSFSSGREKNTRTLGRDVIKAIKQSAWSSSAHGQMEGPQDPMVRALIETLSRRK